MWQVVRKLVLAPWWLAPQLSSLRRLGKTSMTLVTFRMRMSVPVVLFLGVVSFRVVSIVEVGRVATKVSLCSMVLVV